jgi:hypothetical protein
MRSQLSAVEVALCVQYVFTEFSNDLIECRLAQTDDIASEDVSIDNGHAMAREQICNGRFSAPDAAG